MVRLCLSPHTVDSFAFAVQATGIVFCAVVSFVTVVIGRCCFF